MPEWYCRGPAALVILGSREIGSVFAPQNAFADKTPPSLSTVKADRPQQDAPRATPVAAHFDFKDISIHPAGQRVARQPATSAAVSDLPIQRKAMQKVINEQNDRRAEAYSLMSAMCAINWPKFISSGFGRKL